MNRTLNILGFLIFASALSVRAIDPVVPQIAADLSVSLNTAALLAAGFAAYGLAQPVLGPVADAFGKARVMIACLLLLAVTSFLSAIVTDFWLLFALRVLSGVACGGSFPIGMALISDFVPLAQRQVTIGRLLGATISGNLLGAAISGVVADVIHWRGMFVVPRRHQSGGHRARRLRPARAAAQRAAAAQPARRAGAQPRDLRHPGGAHLLRHGGARGAVPVRHLSLCRGAAAQGRRAAGVDRGPRRRGLRGRRARLFA